MGCDVGQTTPRAGTLLYPQEIIVATLTGIDTLDNNFRKGVTTIAQRRLSARTAGTNIAKTDHHAQPRTFHFHTEACHVPTTLFHFWTKTYHFRTETISFANRGYVIYKRKHIISEQNHDTLG